MPLLDLLDSSELLEGRPLAVKSDDRALLIVRVGDTIHAIDGDCPACGFPLAQGSFVGLEVRCERHGGRFDLSTGQCVRGGEDVRRYHAREEAGRLLVQVDEPLAELEQARLVASLRTALIDNDQGRLARECVRLLAARAEPVDVVRVAVRYGAERGAGGFHPALGACADFARVTPLYQGLEQSVALTQALVAVAQANRGRSQRPIPGRARGVMTNTSQSRRAQFVKLVEERDAAGAESMLAGALYQGLPMSEAQQWLLAATSAHVIDGGATLVHAVKALDLCDLLGMREAIYILPCLVPPLVYGIHEEHGPALSEGTRLLEGALDSLPRLVTRAADLPAEGFDDRALRHALLESSATGAFEAVHGALTAGVSPRRVGLGIVLAAAERALRFDDLDEWDDTLQARWGEALEPFCFAVSALRAVDRWNAPETLRNLFQAAAMVQSRRGRDSAAFRSVRATAASPVPSEALGAVISAMRALRPMEAVALAKGFLERGHDPWRLAEALARYTVEDALPSQSLVEQGAAATIAAVDTWEIAGDHPDATLPLLLAVRVLGSDSRQRWHQRHVRQMIARVEAPGR